MVRSSLTFMKTKEIPESKRLEKLHEIFILQKVEIDHIDLELAYGLIRKLCKLAVNQIVK